MKLSKGLILVRTDEPKEQTENGIFIQDEWITNQPIGTVETIADGVTACKVGDRVWFERYTALQHPEDKLLKVCREEAIIAIL